jgi:hypothetical protein
MAAGLDGGLLISQSVHGAHPLQQAMLAQPIKA